MPSTSAEWVIDAPRRSSELTQLPVILVLDHPTEISAVVTHQLF